MAQHSETVELKVLRQHSASFIEAITDVTPVANRLHEKALIDKYTYLKVTERASGLTQMDKATEVVKVLEKTISVLRNVEKRREKFEQILSIFGEFTPLGHVAEEAREAYESSKRDPIRSKEVFPGDDGPGSATKPKSVNADPLSCEPEMHQLVEWVAPQMSSNWRMLGTMLRVPEGELSAIEQDNYRSCQKALIAMLSEWRNSRCSPYTWNNLLQVLRSQIIGEKRLADILTQKVLASS